MKWIKKPIVIEAEQYKEYGKLVKGMCNSQSCYAYGNISPHVHTIHDNQIVILEIGDYIIPEPDGEHYYPCKPDIFEKTYSPFDESINQEGSLKDSDWKAVYDILKESDVCFSSDCDKVGECTHTGHGCSEWERYSKRIWNEVIAPLLQNELGKGDDLVSSVRQDEAAALATLSSQTLTQIEQDKKQRNITPDEIAFMKKAAKDLCWQCWSMWSGFNLDTPIEEFEKRDKHFEAWWRGKSLELNMPNRITEPHNGASQQQPNSSTGDGQQNPSQLKEATILSAPQMLEKNCFEMGYNEIGFKMFKESCLYKASVAAMEEYKKSV